MNELIRDVLKVAVDEEFEARADFAKLILRATQQESWELTKICEALNECLEALGES